MLQTATWQAGVWMAPQSVPQGSGTSPPALLVAAPLPPTLLEEGLVEPSSSLVSVFEVAQAPASAPIHVTNPRATKPLRQVMLSP
jgi:hypothetical protein